MFVISELQDEIEIRASQMNREFAVEDAIKCKYIGKATEELGIAFHLYNIVEISEYQIKMEKLIANVTFKIIFLRFYPDEVCEGIILYQTEDKIMVGNSLFKQYEIQASDLFENCEFCYENGMNNWVWNYKNNKLIFYNGDKVKFRIKKMRFEDLVVEASMNDQGLGPNTWWD